MILPSIVTPGETDESVRSRTSQNFCDLRTLWELAFRQACDFNHLSIGQIVCMFLS
jgi:hypothetical protein